MSNPGIPRFYVLVLALAAFAVVVPSVAQEPAAPPDQCQKWSILDLRVGMTIGDVKQHYPKLKEWKQAPGSKMWTWNLRAHPATDHLADLGRGSIWNMEGFSQYYEFVLSNGWSTQAKVLGFTVTLGMRVQMPYILEELVRIWGEPIASGPLTWVDESCDVFVQVFPTSGFVQDFDKNIAHLEVGDSATFYAVTMFRYSGVPEIVSDVSHLKVGGRSPTPGNTAQEGKP